MTLPETRYEANIEGTLEQLEKVKELLGENHVAYMVMGDNGIAAFWAKGPDILRQCRQAQELREGDPKTDWASMTPAEKDSLVSMGVGNVGWAMDSKLDPAYILDWLDSDPEAREFLAPKPEPRHDSRQPESVHRPSGGLQQCPAHSRICEPGGGGAHRRPPPPRKPAWRS